MDEFGVVQQIRPGRILPGWRLGVYTGVKIADGKPGRPFARLERSVSSSWRERLLGRRSFTLRADGQDVMVRNRSGLGRHLYEIGRSGETWGTVSMKILAPRYRVRVEVEPLGLDCRFLLGSDEAEVISSRGDVLGTIERFWPGILLEDRESAWIYRVRLPGLAELEAKARDVLFAAAVLKDVLARRHRIGVA